MSSKPDRSSLPTRRDFLVQTAALAGAGATLGSAGCATQGPLPRARERARVSAGEPIRMAVIGTGGMGTEHCRAFCRLAKDGKALVQVVAVADVCAPRLEAARKACAEAQGTEVMAYADYRELLARNDLHGVLIASPEHWHAQMAEDAIAAGIDVYVEKPMTLRLPQALRLYRVARANPEVIVQVGTQFVTHQKYHKARELIARGAIGKPTFSQTSYCRNSKDGEWSYYGIDPAWQPGVNLDWELWCGPAGAAPWDPKVYARWRRYRRWSTGIIGDLLVHVATPMLWALDQGWPTRVVACGGHYVDEAMENHDQVNLTVEMEKEHTLLVAGSTCNEQGLETMIRGHKGTLYLGGKDVVLRPERIWADEVDEEKITCAGTDHDHDELRLDWLRAVRTREPGMSPVELGTKVMVIVDLATRSMWEGKAFRFDPSTLAATEA